MSEMTYPVPRVFSGRRLGARRREAGLSREQLARQVGRSVFSVVDYERDRADPSIGVLAALADALDVPMEALFDEAVSADAA